MDASSPAASIIMTRPRPYEKSAEFARLYYFFEKLTQPRNHRDDDHHHYQGPTSREDPETATAAAAGAAAADGSVPEDIAPLLKNLSAILTKDEPLDRDGDKDEDEDALLLLETGDEAQQVSIPEMPTTASASTTTFATHSLPPGFHPRPASAIVSSPNHAPSRPRRNTVAASALASGVTGTPTRSGSTRFPLREKRYPFTFKLLLHKLYDLEDWAVKVQEVLAASQEQFRPLNHTPPTSPSRPAVNSHSIGSSVGRRGDDDGPCSPRSPGTTFSGALFGPTSPSAIVDSPTTKRRRRRTQSTSKAKASNDASSGAAAPSRPVPPRQSSRAVKKRIVNRRRSTNGLGEGVVGKMGEWMYDAAVSSVDPEQADVRGQESLRRRKRVFSSVGFAEERRFAGRDVTNLTVSF